MRLNDCKFIGNLVADPQLKQKPNRVLTGVLLPWQ